MDRLTRFSSLIPILIAALCWTGGATSQTVAPTALDWRDFNSSDGGFNVKFPGTPKLEIPDLKMGPVVIKRHVSFVRLGESHFQISFIDLPAGSDPDGAMEGGARAIINDGVARGATLLSNESVKHGNCGGREIVLSIPQPGKTGRGLVDTLIFSSGLRFFNVVFETVSDTKSNREAGRTFLDSFTVNGGCSTMVAPSDAPSSQRNEELLEGTPDQASGWRVIENLSLGVRVLMPGAARHVYGQSQSEPFPITHHTYIYSNEGSVYSAEVFGDYPPGWYTTPATYQTAIDLALFSLKRNFERVGFEITPLRDLRLATNPGREFSLINPQRGSHGRAQIYVTTKRLYVFTAFTRSDNPLTQVSQFFSSVRISPN